MKSFAILRTNVGLTTNVKIMVDSEYKLSLESIDTNQTLSQDRYKKMVFSNHNFYDELLPHFFKQTPAEISFDIKYDGDVETMTNDFQHQYDEIYQYGARNITNNKNYIEEYEYFAPLYIKRNNLPKSFIIFRVDGIGLESLDKNIFKSNILKKLKTVKVFDLTKNSPFGEWLERNFTNNSYFPETPLDIDFRNLEFCKWNGIDYNSGGYTTKSLFIDDVLDEEKEIFELEKFIFSNYKNSKVVFPNILNFSFLFDDTPSTPDVYRKWSINRYFGFYIDEMKLVTNISLYKTEQLMDDIVITSGNFISSSKEDPFINGYKYNKPMYVEYLGNYYKVEIVKKSIGVSLQQINKEGYITEEYIENFSNRYKIISDLDLTGKQNQLNKNIGYVNSEKKLVNFDGSFLQIDNFSDADVWLIEIDGVYHNLIQDGNSIRIVTDYSFNFNENSYDYKVGGTTRTVNIGTEFNSDPKKMSIYKLNFTDIKDFDDRIVDTEYSKYEYEKLDELTLTDESKMYFENLNSTSNPKDLDDFIYKNEVVNIPVSSEYTANFETFKIEGGELTDLWRKNPVHCRWSYQNSLSANDWPYLLNNSQIFEDYNRTTNIFEPFPKRIERNLDYFYTINSSTSSYLHHTLHVEKIKSGNIDTTYRFDIDKYLGIATYSVGTSSKFYDFDYFTSFFETKQYFLNSKIVKNVKKYSEFNIGDSSIPNMTLFRGIEFRLQDVDAISIDENGDIDTINLKNSNTFEDYKFSILLSDNNKPFSETTCFNLSIVSQEINSVEFTGTTLTWNSTLSRHTTQDIQIYNYLGWYFKVGGQLSGNYISKVELAGTNLIVTISGLTSNISNFTLSKLENRLFVGPEYIDRLGPGSKIQLQSSCNTGTFSVYKDAITDWNINNNISLIGDQTNSPIYFKFEVRSGLFQKLKAVISTIPYNGKLYYKLVEDNNIKLYCLWSSTQQRWEIYQNFDGINATTIHAFTIDNLSYPLDSSWSLVTTTYLSIDSYYGPIVFPTGCSGSWCHYWESYNNEMNWTIIDDWRMDKKYDKDTIIVFDDILYKSNDEIKSEEPVVNIGQKSVKSAPYNLPEWDYFNPIDNSIFWSPIATYNLGDFVYNNGEYYYCVNSFGSDFWNAEIANSIGGYSNGDVVLFKGKYYISQTSSNNFTPDYSNPWFEKISNSGTPEFVSRSYWSETQPNNPKWEPIEIWNPSKIYNQSSLIVHEDVIYSSDPIESFIPSNQEPGISQLWIKRYSFKPDTNVIYNTYNNSIIEMNNKYYLINSNTTDSTLENGIIIYINKKWKNIFINININDNTLPNINNSDRDEIYTNLYKKLTAYNFIRCVNDLSNKYDFTDYVKYVVIEKDGSINSYSHEKDLVKLPYYLTAEAPDLFQVKVKSLTVEPLPTPPDIKISKTLKDGKFNSISELNWFNNVPIAYNITENKFEPKVFENYHGNKNILKDELYRFSGYYMPLFYDIQIFEKEFEFKEVGNYKFDTSLTDFGMIKERKFRKVNRKGSLLKLRDRKDFKSIYPMIDEFGYSYEDFFIFRSTWDLQYHNETVINDFKFIKDISNTKLNVPNSIIESRGNSITPKDQNLTL